MNPRTDFVIRILDDDEDVLLSLSLVLSGRGWETRTYQRAEDFFANDDHSTPGCLLLDFQLPESDGAEVQRLLDEKGVFLPIVFMTAYGSIDLAVQVMKRGAIDFLQKPVNLESLENLLVRAQKIYTLKKYKFSKIEDLAKTVQELSTREKEIYQALIRDDISNKDLSERFGLSERTVEGHRLALYKKLFCHSRQELLELSSLLNSET